MPFNKDTTRTIKATVLAIGEDLPWQSLDKVLNVPILICEKQKRVRTGQYGEREEYVCTYRTDDESDEATDRFSISSTVVLDQLNDIPDNDLPVAVILKAKYKADGAAVKYYYLAPITLDTPEQQDFPF